MASEYESERESLATLMDLLLELDKLEASGEKQFTLDELRKLIHKYAEKRKIHK